VKAEQKALEAKANPIPTLKKVEVDPSKLLGSQEPAPVIRRGYVPLEDFLDVLRKFDFKKNNKDLITKFIKALNCYFQPKNAVYYLKMFRQLTRRTNNFNKLTHTFDYVKKSVNFITHYT
jgi:hypothetical protein